MGELSQKIITEAREADNKSERGAQSESVLTQEELVIIDSNPNMEMDVKEVRQHSRGGWRLGLLIARNVDNDYGNTEKPWEVEGISRSAWYRNQSRTTDRERSVSPKTSARAFAIRVGSIGKATVIRYLAAWNLAAADGLFSSSSQLFPGDEVSFDSVDDNGREIFTPSLWDKYYKLASGKEKGDEKKDLSGLFNKIQTFIDTEISEWLDVEIVNVGSKKSLPEIIDLINKGQTRLNIWKGEIIEFAEENDLTI